MQAALKQHLASKLFGETADVSRVRLNMLGGGSINQAFKMSLGVEQYFLKVNLAGKYPMMFGCEARGLQAFSALSQFKIPQIVAVGEFQDFAYLALEFIESGKPKPTFWALFGEHLADLHKNTHVLFGWQEDNYIGSLFQSNQQMRKWADFYIINRLDVQLEMAFNSGLLPKSMVASFNKLYTKLDQLIPKEPPALLHGDLWSGNYLVDNQGTPMLIDPAVYFGHREMDLAMMQLFGGFPEKAFQTYQAHFPLENDWQSRVPLHQLYPLLVHVNLFGSGYAAQLAAAIRPFV